MSPTIMRVSDSPCLPWAPLLGSEAVICVVKGGAEDCAADNVKPFRLGGCMLLEVAVLASETLSMKTFASILSALLIAVAAACVFGTCASNLTLVLRLATLDDTEAPKTQDCDLVL